MSWNPDVQTEHEICADTGCTISMADRKFVEHLTGTSPILRMASRIPIRGISSKLHYSDEYMVLTFYIKGSKEGKVKAVKITREIHIVDDLKANLPISRDIMVSEKMKIDMGKQ